MPIPTDKPLKKCRFCDKDVINLGLHIINQHPKIMDQLDENTLISTPQSSSLIQNTGVQTINRPTGQDINSMIREKLDTMLNIKIIEMLSSSKDVSLIDIKKSLEPTQNTSLADVKALHDMIYDQNKGSQINIGTGEEGNGWLDLATAALPIIGQLIPQRKQEIEEVNNDSERTRIEERNTTIRRLIPKKVADNRGESSNTGGESSSANGSEQQDDRKPETINTGNN